MADAAQFWTPLLLLAGILPLGLGPWLARPADRSDAGKGAMDAFIAVSMAGIVVLHIWPHALLTGGVWALLGGLAGLMLPFLLHGPFHHQERKIYPALVAVAFFGLVVHAVLDGIALFLPLAGEVEPLPVEHGDHGHALAEEEAAHGGAGMLALAVVLHRLPMGMAVWWLSVPILGRRAAMAILGLLAGATVVGFFLAEQLLVGSRPPAVAIFEATVAGMLLHVVAGHEHAHHGHGHSTVHCEKAHAPWGSAAGALAGVALLAVLGRAHPVDQRYVDALSFAETLVGLSLFLAPLLALGVLLEGLRGRFFGPLPRAFGGRSLLLPLAVGLGLLGPGWTSIGLFAVAWTAGLTVPAQGVVRPSRTDRGRPWEVLEHRVHHGFVWLFYGVIVVALLEPLVRFPVASGPLGLGTGIAAAALAGAFLCRHPLFGFLVALFLAQGDLPAQIPAVLIYFAVVSWIYRADPSPGRTPWWIPAVCAGSLPVLWQAGRLPAVPELAELVRRSADSWHLLAVVLLAVPLVTRLFRKGFRASLLPVLDPAAEMVFRDRD